MLTAILQAAAVMVSIPHLPDRWTMVCHPAQATGFMWKTGVPVMSKLINQDRIVVRAPTNNCIESGKDRDAVTFLGEVRSVCLNVRASDEPYSSVMSEHCREFYGRLDGKWYITIMCASPRLSMNLRPDGPYELARLSNDLREDAEHDRDEGDSVEVGRCGPATP